MTRNLFEGGLLVITVQLLLLGSLRGGLVVSLVISLSMLVTFAGMVQANVSGNLKSLGAIDFGLIVDGSVVMVENILRRLSNRNADEQPVGVIQRAAQEVARPTFFGALIIVLVYVPILTLHGVEGKTFRPMALTVLFALGDSLVIVIVVMPVLTSYAFREPASERETWLMRKAVRAYVPVLRRALRFPLGTSGIAALVLAGSLAVVPFLGAEFIPTLDEGSIVVTMFRLPGISVAESLHGNKIIESVLREFP